MNKKNVYFVQVDVSTDLNVQSVYLPYTAGVLVASAFSSEIVKENCDFKEFIFLRENADDIVGRIDNPAFMGFSCYSWNSEYNKLLAKAVKERFPECLIVFGGHDVPDNFDLLEDNPFIDVLCHGEGEETIRRLLEAYVMNESFENVNNISFRKEDGYLRTPTVLQTTLDYPSPYLEGWFDDIVASHPDTVFNATLETSRGCPYQCAYCDWGILRAKTRMVPIEKIKKEIRWLSDHKIAFVWGADANFGLYDRDLEIADELIRVKKETGYPERMRMHYAKNNFENVFEIVKKFKECNFDRLGATLSFQSMSPVVLKNIGRTNASLDFYKELLSAYNKSNMRCYSELILGLPGETYESFIQGIGKLFEIGQHFVFDVYSCIVLPNAEMNQKEYIEKHGIKTVRKEVLRYHVKDNSFTVPEYNDIVVETAAMSREEWVRSTDFYWTTKMLHANGFIRLFAIYLYYEMSIAYEKFYDDVLNYLEDNPELFVSGLYSEIKKKTEDLSLGKANRKLTFGPCGDIVWDESEYMVLNVLSQFDLFYEEMAPFLKRYGIPDDIFDDLLAYQKAVMRRPGDELCEISLSYDIHKYINDIYENKHKSPEYRPHRLQLKDSNVYDTWQDFAKFVVWYGRMGWSSYKDNITEIDD